jgi:hypothetical protein
MKKLFYRPSKRGSKMKQSWYVPTFTTSMMERAVK